MNQYKKMLSLRKIIFSIGFTIFSSIAYGQVNPTLQLDGVNGGLVLNRLTNLQRNAIMNPANGTLIFNTESGCLNYYYSENWYALCGFLIEICDIVELPPFLGQI